MDHSASEWIDEARKEALKRREGRVSNEPLPNPPLLEDLLADELQFIDKFNEVEGAGLPVPELSLIIDNSDEMLFLRYRDGDDDRKLHADRDCG